MERDTYKYELLDGNTVVYVGLDPLASLILLCLSIARTSSALRSACAKLVL